MNYKSLVSENEIEDHFKSSKRVSSIVMPEIQAVCIIALDLVSHIHILLCDAFFFFQVEYAIAICIYCHNCSI